MEAREIMKKLSVRVGHATDREHGTGCTAFLFEKRARAAVSFMGASPASHETEILKPTKSVEEIHGILFTGGSAYGLAAAGGVMRYLEELGIGYNTQAAVVPIVPAAAIYDLKYRSADVRPDASWGYEAAKNAAFEVPQGSIGAACGATAGKLLGVENSTKTGFGTCFYEYKGYHIAVFAVVNAVGEVISPEGRIVAGVRGKSGFVPSSILLKEEKLTIRTETNNTTLILVVTDYPLGRDKLKGIAEATHDSIARTIRPSHTPFDGDAVFCVSTSGERLYPDSRELLKFRYAAQLSAEKAIIDAALHA